MYSLYLRLRRLCRFFIRQKVAIRVSRLPLPTGGEQLAEFEARKRVCFCVEDYLIKRKDIVRSEQKIEVF